MTRIHQVELFVFVERCDSTAKLHKSDVGKLISVRYNGEDKSKKR